MRQVIETGIDINRRIFGIASVSQKSRAGIWVFYIVAGFLFLHILNWSAKCGPFATGKYRDQCSEKQKPQTSNELFNEAAYYREQHRETTPYVDLKDEDESTPVPPGHGRATLRANVRSEPSMLGEVITNLNKHQVVKILETQGGWVRVELEEDETGWVWKDLLKP